MTTFSPHIPGRISLDSAQSEKIVPTMEREMTISDSQLWEAYTSGSISAFESIYRLYANELYGYGMSLCSCRETVKDAIQDLFVSLWSSRKNLGHVRSVKAYLFTSFRRRLLVKTRENRKWKLIDVQADNWADLDIHSSDQMRSDQKKHEENLVELNKAMTDLSEKQREIIYLRFYSKLSYDEISKIMVLDKKATYNLMARTLTRLKKLMGGVVILILMDIIGVI